MSQFDPMVRGSIYSLLARLYQQEVDPVFLTQLKSMKLPQNCENPQLEEGYRQVTQWASSATPEQLDLCATEFSNLFLGVTSTSTPGVFPYESIYTSPNRQMNQEVLEQVKVLYRISGVTFRGDSNQLIEDHIASEFAFMAYLCFAGIKDCQQRAFFETHLFNWVPTFCDEMAQYAKTDLYQGLANMTAGWITFDRACI